MIKMINYWIAGPLNGTDRPVCSRATVQLIFYFLPAAGGQHPLCYRWKDGEGLSKNLIFLYNIPILKIRCEKFASLRKSVTIFMARCWRLLAPPDASVPQRWNDLLQHNATAHHLTTKIGAVQTHSPFLCPSALSVWTCTRWAAAGCSSSGPAPCWVSPHLEQCSIAGHSPAASPWTGQTPRPLPPSLGPRATAQR